MEDVWAVRLVVRNVQIALFALAASKTISLPIIFVRLLLFGLAPKAQTRIVRSVSIVSILSTAHVYITAAVTALPAVTAVLTDTIWSHNRLHLQGSASSVMPFPNA